MTIFLTVYLDESNQDCNKICQLQKKKKKKRNRTKSNQKKRDTRKESKETVR